MQNDQRQHRQRVYHSFNKAAPSYNCHAQLQRETGLFLLDMVPSLQVEWSLDLGCATGLMSSQLQQRVAAKRNVSLDLALAMLQQSRCINRVQACFSAIPLRSASIDLVYANLSLQWSYDLSHVLAEVHRILSDRGHLVFSLPVQGTLPEFQACFRAQGRPANRYLQLSDVLFKLMEAKLQVTALKQRQHRLYFSSFTAVVESLKGVGANQRMQTQSRGLGGKGYWAELRDAYHQFALPDSRLPATYQIVYIHASK